MNSCMSETHSFSSRLCACWTTSEQDTHPLDHVIDPQALLMPRAKARDNDSLTSNLVTTKDKMRLICTIVGDTWTASKTCVLCGLITKHKLFFVLWTKASTKPEHLMREFASTGNRVSAYTTHNVVCRPTDTPKSRLYRQNR